MAAWESELSGLKARIGPVFGRRELRETAGAFLDGLLSGVERKTGWLTAKQAGLGHPGTVQARLGRSRWEADGFRDRVRADVLDALSDPDGVLVVDEAGIVKGTHSVGVARQYSGTAGRVENAQVGVFLAYASRYGQALIDRRLYLPEASAGDRERRTRAGVPAEMNRLSALLPSAPEIRSLLARIIFRPPPGIAFILEWSLWRGRQAGESSSRPLQTPATCATGVLDV